MKEKSMQITRKIWILFMMAVLILVYSNSAVNVMGATIEGEGASSSVTGNFTPQHTADGEYVPSTNTYSDGGAKFYFVTHDNSKANLKTVNYDGKEFAVEAVAVVPDNFDFQQLTFINQSGDTFKLLNSGQNTKDFTIFFDDGLYNDTNSTNYTGLSKENASYIGLNKDAQGEPATTISRNPRSGTGNVNIDDKMERYIIMSQNVYIENLKFDGKGKDMYPVGGGSGSGKVPKNRGEYFFTITGGGKDKGADGFLVNDVILENIGAENSTEYPSLWGVDTRNKNIAINVLYNPGQVNIENVKIRNIKTTEGYGIIQNEYVDSVFYKNLDIDASMANPKSRSIKIEQSGTQSQGSPTYILPENQGVVFGGSINLPEDEMHNHIYVQDYRYKYIKAPSEFKYAFWNISNGSYFSAALEIHKSLPKTTDGRAIHDLEDNYWIVNANQDSAVTVEKQLEDILKVMKYTVANDGTKRAPQGTVKLVTSTEIPSFKVPDGFKDIPLEIIAVNEFTDKYQSKDLVPVGADSVIELPSTNKVKLYNFDFHDKAKLTLKEAVSGIKALENGELQDPLETSNIGGADYPKYETYAKDLPKEARVKGSTEKETFVNCKFTVLAKELSIVNKPKNNIIQVDTPYDLNHEFKAGYTIKDNLDPLVKPIDDTTVMWGSSDDNIATVDQDGKVTPKKDGNVTIYLKALDKNNNGEIEKPFDSYTLTIKKTPKVVYEFISEEEGTTLPKEVTDLLPDEKTSVYYTIEEAPTIDPTTIILPSGNWIFMGWDKSSLTVENEVEKFVGKWKVQEKTSMNVSKTWKGIEADKAPEVTLTLYKNGEKTDKTLSLNKNNNWQGAFKELFKLDDGSNEVNVYTVKEQGEEGGKITLDGVNYNVSYNGGHVTNEKVSENNVNPPTKPTEKKVVNVKTPDTGDSSTLLLHFVTLVVAIILLVLIKKGVSTKNSK